MMRTNVSFAHMISCPPLNITCETAGYWRLCGSKRSGDRGRGGGGNTNISLGFRWLPYIITITGGGMFSVSKCRAEGKGRGGKTKECYRNEISQPLIGLVGGTPIIDNRKHLRTEEAIEPESGSVRQGFVSAAGNPVSWPVNQLPVSV